MPKPEENLEENQEEKNEQEEAEQSQEESSEEENEENSSEENSEESEEQEEGSENNSSVSDDMPVEVEVDGKKETITLGEIKKGYMRQSDYTRKTQELKESMKNASPEEKKEVTDKAQEVIDNPENFSKEDVDTARALLKIVKGTGLAKEFGLMTKEEFQAEKEKEKRVSEVNTQFQEADKKVSQMKGMPKFNEDEVLEHMEKTGIHNPYAAYLNLNDSAYRNYIIKQAKGNTSYKSDKGGKKPEPTKKEVDVRSEEGHRSYLADEIKKLSD